MVTHTPLLRLVITTHDGSKSLGSIRHVTGYSGPFAHIAVGGKARWPANELTICRNL